MPTTSKPTTPHKPTRQTVRIGGKRTVLTTRNGKVTAKAALPEEWELQAEQVKRLRGMPEYGKLFLFAGDQNAAKRGPRARVQALAAGMIAGEPDVRVYLPGGRVALIENKVGSGPLSPAQKDRHVALAKLGHDVAVVRATHEQDAADQAEALVRGWICAKTENSA